MAEEDSPTRGPSPGGDSEEELAPGDGRRVLGGGGDSCHGLRPPRWSCAASCLVGGGATQAGCPGWGSVLGFKGILVLPGILN